MAKCKKVKFEYADRWVWATWCECHGIRRARKGLPKSANKLEVMAQAIYTRYGVDAAATTVQYVTKWPMPECYAQITEWRGAVRDWHKV